MSGSRDVPHPIPYQGSKRSLASHILAKIPGHVARFVEPFAGSAAMTLAVSFHRRATSFWLNDAHVPLADLWTAIIERPKELSRRYADLWHEQIGNERRFYDEVRHRFNRDHRPEHFLYLLARCVKACIRYNADGEFNNSPDNRRKGARPAEMARRIHGAAELLNGSAWVSAQDFKDVLRQCRDGDLVYMDPPYQGVCLHRDNRYAPRFDHDEFCDELDALNRRRIRYLVSYDGRTGQKVFGKPLPRTLSLERVELCAGRSTQATLLGRDCVTYESLYVSPALTADLRKVTSHRQQGEQRQLAFG